MPKKQLTKKIERAYCIELDKVISIDEARIASQKRAILGRGRRFIFYALLLSVEKKGFLLQVFYITEIQKKKKFHLHLVLK